MITMLRDKNMRRETTMTLMVMTVMKVMKI